MQRLKIILNYGSMAGLSAYAMFLIYYYVLGLNPMGNIKILSLSIPVVFMYLALKKHRDIEMEGFSTFSGLFRVSITFTFIYSSLSAMLVFLHSTIDPGFVKIISQETLATYGQLKEMMLNVMSRDEYQKLISDAENLTGAQVALTDFTSKTIGAFIIALIISGILKKQPPVFEERND